MSNSKITREIAIDLRMAAASLRRILNDFLPRLDDDAPGAADIKDQIARIAEEIECLRGQYDTADAEPDPASRKAAAHHEAGHAVLACLYRHKFELVTIKPNEAEGSLGHVLFVTDDDFDPGLLDMDDLEDRQRVEEHIQVALAGEAAEYLLTGTRNREGAGWGEDLIGDSRIVFEILSRIFGLSSDPGAPQNQEMEAYQAWLWWKTVNDLMQRFTRSAVETVASLLMEQESLDQAQVISVLDAMREEALAGVDVGP